MPELIPILARIGLATITAALITYVLAMGTIITTVYWRHRT